ncbi:hypothetical protein B0H10DRAFT_2062839 [Mycena sp. CBHHK59/15]|nr:hypothetical protein B0H10DRAFT_2062839 [Mycena sp. CBHHK59/15]
MKEATAINVQTHVEQLKKELAREVRADLFAFYSKQKPGVTLAAASRPQHMYVPHMRTASPLRPLPEPQRAFYPQ